MSVILATWEAEIKRIAFGSQPEQRVLNPILKIPNTKQGSSGGMA
jgi:hypothetical protein